MRSSVHDAEKSQLDFCAALDDVSSSGVPRPGDREGATQPAGTERLSVRGRVLDVLSFCVCDRLCLLGSCCVDCSPGFQAQSQERHAGCVRVSPSRSHLERTPSTNGSDANC